MRIAIACTVLLLALAIDSVAAAASSEPPNIVLILVDDLGDRSLSCFGGTIPTPHLDQLARGGMVFTNAHAAPMCAPTRDEMFTGYSRAGRDRPGAETTFFTNDLQKLGYKTGRAGKWFVGNVFNPPLRGFDETLATVNGYRQWAPDVMVFGSGGMLKELNQPPVTGRLNEWEIPLEADSPHIATRFPDRHGEDISVDFLCDFIKRHQEGPFFAFYSSKLTHVPQAPMPDGDEDEIKVYKTAFNQVNDRKLMSSIGKFASEEAARCEIVLNTQDYRNAGIAYADKMAGRLIDQLDEQGIRENTLVLFLSDNGNSQLDPLAKGSQSLPGRKGDSREGGTRIPLIANWPAKIKPGSECNDLVHVQDFMPTLLELAGGSQPKDREIDGISFAPQLLGKPGASREYFVGSGAHESIWLDRVAAELGKPDLQPYPISWVHGLRYKLYSDGRFYDLENDLEESNRILPGEGTAKEEAIRQKYAAILKRYPIK